ncbi:MAG: ABC transporter ATP-binding protein [Thermomicrobiales bacterium]
MESNPAPGNSGRTVLQVNDLSVDYHTEAGPVKAVQHVSFDLRTGERLGLVGESGSGKSTIALALMRMIRPPGRIESGSILFDELDLVALSEEAMRQVRLARVALVAQGAMNSLNPVKRVRDQLRYSLRDHGTEMGKSELKAFSAELLQRVGLKPTVADMFPHELSGGMKQRVCIAIAISLNPQIIIADEPTSALDVVVQWQVIETLRKVQEELGAAVIQIGHDMGLMAQSVERLGVMYAGKLVELAPVGEIFSNPLHPYTRLLIESLPSLDHKEALQGIPGLPPSLLNRESGDCPFQPRCPRAFEPCATVEPVFQEVSPGHWVTCHLHDDRFAPTPVSKRD